MKALSGHVMRDHVLIGTVPALLLLPVWGWRGSLLFWFANILVDLDHYFHFLYLTRMRHFAPGPMMRYFEKVFSLRHREDFLALEIFHTLEFFFVAGLVIFTVLPVLVPFFWGMAFHMLVDFFHLSRHGILGKRVNSFVEYKLRSREMKGRGVDPDGVFKESLDVLGR